MQIAMGTFILSFIGNSFVASAQRATLPRFLASEAKRRRALVLVFFASIVSIVSIFGLMTIPNLIRCSIDPLQHKFRAAGSPVLANAVCCPLQVACLLGMRCLLSMSCGHWQLLFSGILQVTKLKNSVVEPRLHTLLSDRLRIKLDPS